MDYATNRAPAAREDRNAWAEPGVEDLGDGLYRIPLPLPGDALTAVNVYAMAGDDGVDLIDAGMALVQARERLTGALAQLGYGLPDIRNFFITHIHQDHYTLAVELRTTLRGLITLGAGERANMDAIRDVAEGRAEVGFIEMLPRMGAAELAAQVRELLGPRFADPQPKLEWSDPDRWLPDGAVHRPARPDAARHPHARAHQRPRRVPRRGGRAAVRWRPRAAAHHPVDRLPAGHHPVCRSTQYLGSLRLMLALPDTRLLPAHGPVQPSTHARVHQLLEHHETRLAQTLAAATAGPVTAFQAAGALPWTRRQRKLAELDVMNQLLATGETAAHLEVLVARGQLARERSAEGIDRYGPVPPTTVSPTTGPATAGE